MSIWGLLTDGPLAALRCPSHPTLRRGLGESEGMRRQDGVETTLTAVSGKGEEGTLKCRDSYVDFGDMAKLVDALDLGSSEEIRVSSSLTIPTRNQLLPCCKSNSIQPQMPRK